MYSTALWSEVYCVSSSWLYSPQTDTLRATQFIHYEVAEYVMLIAASDWLRLFASPDRVSYAPMTQNIIAEVKNIEIIYLCLPRNIEESE